MRTTAKIYLTLSIALGVAIILYAMLSWQSEMPGRFLCYCVLALFASCCKVHLPGITGTMSVNFLFILLGVVELTFSETLLMGCASIVVQSLWRTRKRPSAVQAAFNVTSVAIATTVSFFCFHLLAQTSLHPALPFLLGLAASSYFLTNTGMVSVIVSLTEGKPLIRTWKECYFWSFLYYLLGASLVGILTEVHKSVGWQSTLFLIPLLYWIYRSYRAYLDRLEAETVHANQMAGLHLRTIEALALAIDAKDHYTHGHVRRVESYAIEIGQALGLSDDELKALRAAAILHDIGKLGVPEHIISKPGRLTPGEFEKMKTHPIIGCQILEQVKFPYPVAPIVRSHHERWDGTGYPDGLKGEQIPIGARILGAVDCLDALASDRQYRRALSLDDAMEFVASQAGTGYDPQVVAILQRRYLELEATAKRRTDGISRPQDGLEVRKGGAPAAGFAPAVKGALDVRFEFIHTIAAARQEAQDLFELAKELGNSLSLSETLAVLGTRLTKLVPYDSIAIYICGDGVLTPRFVSGKHSRFISQMRVGEGLSGWVAENRTPIVNGNPSVEPFYMGTPETTGSLRTALSVPLEGPDGLTGVLTLYHCEKDAFTMDHLRLLQAVTYKMAQAIQNALEFCQAQTHATADALTGLPNARSLFLHLDQELSRSKRSGQSLAVLVCDLDGFKTINDRFGHLEGNRALKRVAQVLREGCREYDSVARMGGDEFVLVLPDCSPVLVEALQLRLSRAVADLSREMYQDDILGISIGKAHYPVDGTDAEQLLAEADRRMYAVKQTHRQYPSRVGTLRWQPALVQ
jgi:diguanylate cyclase (GGDEF)-like protein/putative nucleotidyltransferase with HDIG domain